MPLNIYQRINAVRKKVLYVRKDANVQGYKAVTHDMVTAVLRDALIEAGIVIVTTQTKGESIPAGETKNGTPIIRYEAWYRVTFVNMDDPEDRILMEIQSHANDMSDKAPGKAISYAVKYALLKTFSLETGENEESRMEGERKGKLVAEHLKEELDEYIEAGDSLAINLFSKAIGQEMWTDLYNSAPQGQKVAFKKRLDVLNAQGHDVLVEINQALIEDDGLRAKENISDITPGCKKLLAGYLGREKAQLLGKLTEAA